jgi:hypothetical protein
MLAIVYACALVGLEGHIIEVQVDFNPRAGIPSFNIVGLPDTAVKESRERVRAAIKNSNRSTIRHQRGGTPQDVDWLTTTSEDQNLHMNEQQGFGLQFPSWEYTL